MFNPWPAFYCTLEGLICSWDGLSYYLAGRAVCIRSSIDCHRCSSLDPFQQCASKRIDPLWHLRFLIRSVSSTGCLNVVLPFQCPFHTRTSQDATSAETWNQGVSHLLLAPAFLSNLSFSRLLQLDYPFGGPFLVHTPAACPSPLGRACLSTISL
jgi:hypothetical protein